MAFLIRPSTKDTKELILQITPRHGPVFARSELYSVVGVDFDTIELLSGDFLLVTGGKDTIKNNLASFLSNSRVNGPSILCEPKEID